MCVCGSPAKNKFSVTHHRLLSFLSSSSLLAHFLPFPPSFSLLFHPNRVNCRFAWLPGVSRVAAAALLLWHFFALVCIGNGRVAAPAAAAVVVVPDSVSTQNKTLSAYHYWAAKWSSLQLLFLPALFSFFLSFLQQCELQIVIYIFIHLMRRRKKKKEEKERNNSAVHWSVSQWLSSPPCFAF